MSPHPQKRTFGDSSRWLINKSREVGWLLHEPVSNGVPAQVLPSFEAACALFAAIVRHDAAPVRRNVMDPQ